MTDKEKVEMVISVTDEEVILFESPSYEGALIGLTQDYRAIYSYDKMIESLMIHENMSMEDAIEFIDYNTASAYISPKQPIICYDIPSDLNDFENNDEALKSYLETYENMQKNDD